MSISKDQSIITQVAAKIAADLVPDGGDINANIANWAVAFDAVLDGIMSAHNIQPAGSATAQTPTHTSEVAQSDPMSMIQQAFPDAEQAPTNSPFNIQVRGTQHGPLPDWLPAACAKAGVSAIYDNRDGLAVNPKRPWFKAADGTKNAKGDDVAFWPPR